MSYMCKSGRHAWTQPEDADKCCNGWRRELRVAQQTLHETLPQDARSVSYVAGALVGRVWVKEEDATHG